MDIKCPIIASCTLRVSLSLWQKLLYKESKQKCVIITASSSHPLCVAVDSRVIEILKLLQSIIYQAKYSYSYLVSLFSFSSS